MRIKLIATTLLVLALVGMGQKAGLKTYLE